MEQPDGTIAERKAMWERWNGGNRTTWVDSDGRVRIVLAEDRGRLRISTTITPEALYQETQCDIGRARENHWSPLISDENRFFNAARSVPYNAYFVENLSAKVGEDGTIDINRHLSVSDDQWLGGSRDRYQTTMVTSDNGVVRRGRGEHGIAIGYVPPMNVVE